MPSIKPDQKNKTSRFNAISEESASFNDSNDCAVKAIALVCGLTYAASHALCLKQGRKQDCGMLTVHILDLVKELGYKYERVQKHEMIDQYPGTHKNLKNMTTHHPARFNKVWADSQAYLAFIDGHVLTIINGENHDWTRGRAKRILCLYRITKAA